MSTRDERFLEYLERKKLEGAPNPITPIEQKIIMSDLTEKGRFATVNTADCKKCEIFSKWFNVNNSDYIMNFWSYKPFLRATRCELTMSEKPSDFLFHWLDDFEPGFNS